MSAEVVDDAIKVGCVTHQTGEVHNIQRHGYVSGPIRAGARRSQLDIEQSADDVLYLGSEFLLVGFQNEIGGVEAPNEFPVPIPQQLARLVESAGGRDERVPNMSRMVKDMEESLLPQQLVSGTDEVACTLASCSERDQLRWLEIRQDELQQLGGQLDEAVRCLHVEHLARQVDGGREIMHQVPTRGTTEAGMGRLYMLAGCLGGPA